MKHGYVLQFDGERTKAMYELGDSLMERNLIGDRSQERRSKGGDGARGEGDCTAVYGKNDRGQTDHELH